MTHVIPRTGLAALSNRINAPLAALIAMLATLAVTTAARAETGWFAYGAASGVRSVREELDVLLYPIEVETWESGWELGGGLRIFSQTGMTQGRPKWEIRLRTGASGGSLQDVHVEYGRTPPTQPPLYTAVTDETFTYSAWVLGATALANVHPKIGLFAGPVLQRVTFKGELDRVWDGDIPNFCFDCGDAQGSTDSTVIYGLLELGARITPLARPIGLEVFWAPRRITMSSDLQVGDDGYSPNFADLDTSWGARLTWDF